MYVRNILLSPFDATIQQSLPPRHSIFLHKQQLRKVLQLCAMVGVAGVVMCVALVYTAATSTSKADVYLNGCTSHGVLFPLDHTHPAHWKSCNDAYEYTWMSDFSGYLRGLSLTNRMRLAYSMVDVALPIKFHRFCFADSSMHQGFCPHLRCQLQSIGNSGANGVCPEGACFAKLEVS